MVTREKWGKNIHPAGLRWSTGDAYDRGRRLVMSRESEAAPCTGRIARAGAGDTDAAPLSRRVGGWAKVGKPLAARLSSPHPTHARAESLPVDVS